MNPVFAPSELIINADGSIYHLNLLPEDIASTVITVGDPDRVEKISKYFDHIELKKGKREFITHTGYIGSHRISVLSTGIGTDNIDIVMNELDALVNIDFENRTEKSEKKSLSIIRIGTSGTFQTNIEVGSILASTHAVGLDALMHYYDWKLEDTESQNLQQALLLYFKKFDGIKPYLTTGSEILYSKIATEMNQGITLTAPGFYAPQGRLLRAKSILATQLISDFQKFNYKNKVLTNLEMETSGIYALAKILGHKALSVNAILANRVLGKFHTNPDIIVQKCIEMVLDKITASHP